MKNKLYERQNQAKLKTKIRCIWPKPRCII